MQKTQALVICTLIASVVAASSVMALLTTQKTVSGTGAIKAVGLGVYWDLQCTNSTSALDFGLLEPGASKNFTLYLRNNGNSPLILSMTTQNWNPSTGSSYMTLSWNREGQQISPAQVIQFVIVLSVSPSITGISSFSFDIIITGTG